jgi:DnaJ-class molecular chaperone
MEARVEPLHVVVGVSWINVKLGETIEVEAPHRRIRIPLPPDARPGDRLRLRGQGAEPDLIVTLHFAAQPTFGEALRRFVSDFGKPGATA